MLVCNSQKQTTNSHICSQTLLGGQIQFLVGNFIMLGEQGVSGGRVGGFGSRYSLFHGDAELLSSDLQAPSKMPVAEEELLKYLLINCRVLILVCLLRLLKSTRWG